MKLGIVLLTYNRKEYAEKTLRSTLDNIQWNGEIGVHIADDGSGPEYLDYLCKVVQAYVYKNKVSGLTLSDSGRKGYGANYNLGMQSVHDYVDFVLPLEDDWELTRPFNMTEIAQVLTDIGGGCVRLGYLGYTQSLIAKFVVTRAGHWLEFEPTSPEPHVFAGHPRLESIGWSKRLGEWPENMSPGDTEFAVAHRDVSRHKVYWPLQQVKPNGDLFVHIGTERSY